jgi:hypothetical protein
MSMYRNAVAAVCVQGYTTNAKSFLLDKKPTGIIKMTAFLARVNLMKQSLEVNKMPMYRNAVAAVSIQVLADEMLELLHSLVVREQAVPLVYLNSKWYRG